MSLFGAKKVETKETPITDYVKMVETFLKKVDLNPTQQRLPNRDTLGWWVQRGSALIYITLNQHESVPTLRVLSPILYLPENYILPFYRRCLELNMELIHCAFGVINDRITLVSERPLKGLDQQELEGLIGYLSSMADEMDDKLGAEFNAQKYTQGGR
jgi:hypothetical protein